MDASRCYTCYSILTLCGIPNNAIQFSALIITIASPTCALDARPSGF
ncbi:hypothetical protein ACZ87_02676 [Candidatus Erwinia dacicola]|uniref:Uncharacterized protein n=1 Tax=Candidatus Erwinia dacicola TaxID=252393 RepID=A0A328TN63_9GAMM|nr:hypothetical protein ACZ87_02676 [Candidatus Erwinia dacicola]